jgi:hypothetical protein
MDQMAHINEMQTQFQSEHLDRTDLKEPKRSWESGAETGVKNAVCGYGFRMGKMKAVYYENHAKPMCKVQSY